GVVEPDLINPDFKAELLRVNPFHALLDSYMVRNLMEGSDPIFAESAKIICNALSIKMPAYTLLGEEYEAFLRDPNVFERDKLTTSLLGVILADYFVRSQQEAI